MIEDIFKTATPYILASIGGLFTELCGSLNIALEGQILIGAFWAIVVSNMTGSIVLGLLAAVAASSLLALITALFSFRFRANIFISGLAANLLAYGLVTVFSTILVKGGGVIRAETAIQGSSYFFTVFALLLLPLSWYVINYTPYGMRCRVAGLSEAVLYYRGISPDFYRYTALLISGVLCGIAGASLAARIGAFVPNISSGRGWIALVAIYLGYRKPQWVFLSCILFASAESLANWTQGFIGMPATVILALPYLITLSVLTIVSAVRKKTEQR
ncbi:MAG: ABC transporter permease [Spirochaetales bacterium]|nr:ABC transporter permease [Spirochaetales bacterium]